MAFFRHGEARNVMTRVRSNDKASKRPARSHQLDEIDLQILRELQASSKITNAALAQRIGISPPATMERVRRLEQSGVITGYVALVNPDAIIGGAITALVYVSLGSHSKTSLERAKEMLSRFDDVMACWHTAGDEDFVLQVLVADMQHYERFVSQKLTTVPNIRTIRTAFVLSVIKQTTELPAGLYDADAGHASRTSRRRSRTRSSR